MATLHECLSEIEAASPHGDQTVLSDGATDWTIEGLRDALDNGDCAEAETWDDYRVIGCGWEGNAGLCIVQVGADGYDMSPAAYVVRGAAGAED